jgi:hypothetical protein
LGPITLTLPLTKALDVGYDQPTTGVGTGALRRESLEGKAQKGEVGYEDPAQGSNHCSQCAHFVLPTACERVEGAIAPGAWCQLWTKGTEMNKTAFDQLDRLTKATLTKAFGEKEEKYKLDDPSLHTRSGAIGKIVKEKYGHDDGDDLAFNLMRLGVIGKSHTDEHAAQIVAQHLGQP